MTEKSATFRLSAGKEVTLLQLTVAQRAEAEEAAALIYLPDGSQRVIGLIKSRNLWCMHGLGLADIEGLVDFSGPGLNEIAAEVIERAGGFQIWDMQLNTRNKA